MGRHFHGKKAKERTCPKVLELEDCSAPSYLFLGHILMNPP